MGVGGQRHAPAALPPGKTRYPLFRRLGGPQSRSGRVRKISPLTGIRSPDRPARSESLYRLSYPDSPLNVALLHFLVSLIKTPTSKQLDGACRSDDGCILYISVSQTFFKCRPLSLVRMLYGPPYSWDYQTH